MSAPRLDPHVHAQTEASKVITLNPIEWANYIRETQARAWDEGHRSVCRRHGVMPFDACRNPYEAGDDD